MIRGTVALPIFNSHRITWLCLESLCRQIRPVDGWELIVMECVHPTMITERFLAAYEDRLRDAGCERIEYILTEKRIPLSQKWVNIARASSDTSEYFCLCAADNHYSPWMLVDAEENIKKADWCLVTRGYFYDFFYNKIIEYNYSALVGLQMTAKTSMVRKFNMDEVWKGVDTWFSTQIQYENGHKRKISCFIDCSDHYRRILCTNGLNNISTERWSFFDKIRPPFYPSAVELADIVDDDIAGRLLELSKGLNDEHIDNGGGWVNRI